MFFFILLQFIDNFYQGSNQEKTLLTRLTTQKTKEGHLPGTNKRHKHYDAINRFMNECRSNPNNALEALNTLFTEVQPHKTSSIKSNRNKDALYAAHTKKTGSSDSFTHKKRRQDKPPFINEEKGDVNAPPQNIMNESATTTTYVSRINEARENVNLTEAKSIPNEAEKEESNLRSNVESTKAQSFHTSNNTNSVHTNQEKNQTSKSSSSKCPEVISTISSGLTWTYNALTNVSNNTDTPLDGQYSARKHGR